MNTQPMFGESRAAVLARARACEEHAAKRLAWIRRRVRELAEQLRVYELALTDAALKGRFPSEGSLAHVLEGQLDGMRLEQRVAEADLYAAEARRRALELAA